MVDVKNVETDILILGGGFSGCGAAYEAAYWAKAAGLKVTLVEKAAIERSGAVAQGLSAINTYMGMSGRAEYGQNKPEDFVKYVTTDMMGIAREDLVYDIGRHVDGTVHLFEKWGLPIFKNEEGKYVREGPWQLLIHGESYKPIIAEAAKMAIGEENIYERVFITHLLMDKNNPKRVAGAVGFSVRKDEFYVFKAKAVIIATGGATLLFRPRNVGEGSGRTWYAIFDTGSGYAMAIWAGAEMTQMEHRFIPFRYKDGYGPVGCWFLFFKCKATNAYGEEYITKKETIAEYEPYASATPVPTPLRNHQALVELEAGRGPIYMRTDEAIAKLKEEGADLKHLLNEAWEDFLDMTISQALLWAAQNIDPAEKPSEAFTAEPYIMGSHSGCSGIWVAGPEDISPDEYKQTFPFNGAYNRMTTIEGLFAIGDNAGASAHKFSSGSFTEGRLAGKAAVRYIVEQNPNPEIDEAKVEELKELVYKPFKTFEEGKGASTREDVNPNYILPRQGLTRLQKIMDDYAAGASTWYRTNEKMLERALELLQMLKEDCQKLAARDLHELLRAWELIHRIWTAEAHIRHMLFRQETRWPGYYYRMDYPKIDDENWKCFVNSTYDAEKGEWNVFKRPYVQLVK